MSDIATNWAATRGDWSLVGSDLTRGSDLVTSVLISLFTDRVATPDDIVPDGSADPRGFWADDPRYPSGSRLWLLGRAKRTQETLGLARGYIVEALQWLIDDGVVSSLDVALEWTARGTLSARITIYAPESAAYGAEPVARLALGDLSRLSDVQAWGWNGELGSGQWVSIATAPQTAGGVAPAPPDLTRGRAIEDGSARYTQDGARRTTQ